MVELLKIEWLKIRKYRAFLILVGLFAVSIIGVNYVTYATLNAFGAGLPAVEDGMPSGDMVTEFLFGHPFAYPEVWHTVSYLSSFLLFIPGLIIILLTANEFSFKTHRQSVIDGVSRREYMMAKIALTVVIGIGVSLLVFIAGIIFGQAGASSFSLKNIEYIFYFFIQSLTYTGFALALVLFLKKSGISIGIYFLYISIIKNVLALLMNHKLVSGSGDYLPVKSADLLIPTPTGIGKLLSPDQPEPLFMLVASLGWIAVMYWLCMWKFRRSDL